MIENDSKDVRHGYRGEGFGVGVDDVDAVYVVAAHEGDDFGESRRRLACEVPYPTGAGRFLWF